MQSDARLIPKCVIGAALVAGCTGTDKPAQEPPDAGGDASNEVSSDALDELFQDGSPEDIAAELEAMVDAGEEDAGPTPIYKGVSF